jgi:phospholipase D1/2
MPILNHLANKVKHKFRHGVNNVIKNEECQDDDREEEYLMEDHRYESFAPIRQEAMVKYFIDGHDYCWFVIVI